MTERNGGNSALDVLKAYLTEPSSQGLADAVSHGIRDGVLEPGTTLPPIRAVASALWLARTTVATAWAALSRAGMIYTDGRRGTIVAGRAPTTEPVRCRRALQYSVRFECDLSTGLPDASLLPDLAPRLHRLQPVEGHLGSRVLPELLEHLHSDWPFRAGDITIADGVMESLDLVVTTFLRFGDRIAVEHLSDPPVLDLLEARGLRLIPVDMDEEGPVPASLANAMRAGARAAILQPRAHQPTAISTTCERAAELAGVLHGQEIRVIEVDYLGELASSPLHSMGRTIPERTVHIRGYTASHGPEVRLAAIGGPAELIDTLVQRRHLGQGWTSHLLQRLLFDLLTDPASVRQVEYARSEYDRRRRALVAELDKRRIKIGGSDGRYVWMPVASEATALVSLTSQGIGAAPGTPFVVRRGAGSHIAITAHLLPVEHAARIAQALAEAARPVGGGRVASAAEHELAHQPT